MTIRVGNAASPRWYDLSANRFDVFVDALASWGASSAELVLHAGEADQRTAHVHILEADWEKVAKRFQRSGFVCHIHAPLEPRYKLDRWRHDERGLKESFEPILAATRAFSLGQSEPPVLVIHAAGGRSDEAKVATSGFANWAIDQLEDCGSTIAIELRKPTHDGLGFDRSRDSLLAFVDELDNERIGICWDVAHDWEGRVAVESWTPLASDAFLRGVKHVHLHDGGRFDQHHDVHFPLQSDDVPWRQMLSPLIRQGYHGAISIEARYRYARSLGDPWMLLENSISQVLDWLKELRTGNDPVRNPARS